MCRSAASSITSRPTRRNDQLTFGWAHRQKQSWLTIPLCDSAYLVFALYFYACASKICSSVFKSTSTRFDGFWTLQMQLEDSHGSDSVYSNVTLTSCIALPSITRGPTLFSDFHPEVPTTNRWKIGSLPSCFKNSDKIETTTTSSFALKSHKNNH